MEFFKKFLSKEDIFKADDMDYEVVDVPEWGGKVKVKTMTGTERDAFETSLFETKGVNVSGNMSNMRAKLIASCATHENGDRLFSEKDIKKLGNKSAKALDRLFSVAQKLNGIGTSEVEELTKNSDGEEADSSPSV